MITNIKKCPFCGGQPKVKNESGYDAGTYITCPNTDCEPQPHVFVPCGSVKIPTHKESEQAALSLWNRRATVSMETANKMAEALEFVSKFGKLGCVSGGVAKQALAQFNREKGGEG